MNDHTHSEQAVIDKAREHYETRADRRPRQVWNAMKLMWEKVPR